MRNSSSSCIIDIYIHRLQYFFNNHQLIINLKKKYKIQKSRNKNVKQNLSCNIYLSSLPNLLPLSCNISAINKPETNGKQYSQKYSSNDLKEPRDTDKSRKTVTRGKKFVEEKRRAAL